MFVEDMVHLGKVRSEIREIFEYITNVIFSTTFIFTTIPFF